MFLSKFCIIFSLCYEIYFLFVDVSEEILSKYRNITPMSAGLMEDDQNCDENVSVKETEFDDCFKFEDAKRKLRIVLCMADRSNFPR